MATAPKKLSKPEVENEESHPLGGALGMAVGGVAGGAAAGVAAAGAMATIGGVAAGPVGAVAGAALGGALGGKLGEAAAEAINPDEEVAYWETHYQNRPYVKGDTNFDAYRPAYRYGAEASAKYRDRSFEEIESELDHGWSSARGDSSLDWARAREASRDAYNRPRAPESEKHSFSGNMKEFGGFVKEETGEIINDKEMMDEGRALRNEGRMEKGKAPKLTEPGTGN